MREKYPWDRLGSIPANEPIQSDPIQLKQGWIGCADKLVEPDKLFTTAV